MIVAVKEPDDKDIEQHFGLVRVIANRLWSNYENVRRIGDRADVFQVGCMGLVYATRDFDAARGAKFSDYAGVVIANQIQQAARSLHPTSQLEDAERMIATSDSEPPEFPNAKLTKLLLCLPDKQRVALTLYYGLLKRKQRSLERIGRKLGVKKQAVHGLVRRGRARMEELMGDDPDMREFMEWWRRER